MKKYAFWWQIAATCLWIVGAILLIVFWFFGDKDIIKICGDWVLLIALILSINGVWKIAELFYTQKELQKHFDKNEEDKKEIEELKKINVKHE